MVVCIITQPLFSVRVPHAGEPGDIHPVATAEQCLPERGPERVAANGRQSEFEGFCQGYMM